MLNVEYLQQSIGKNVEYYPRQRQVLPVEPVRIIIIQQPKSDDNHIYYIIIILCLFFLYWYTGNKNNQMSNENVNTPNTVDVPYTVDWSPSRVNDVPYIVNWYPKITQSAIYNGTPSKLRLGRRYIPQDVVNLAFQYTNSREQALFLLAMCYHERGIKGWYDSFLCGYGATDTKWYSKYSGWQKQLRYASSKVRRYFNNRLVSNQTAQGFARDSYKTTHWWNYANTWNYYNTLMGQY